MAILLALVACCICAAIGRTALNRLAVPDLSASERFVCAAAIGLGVAGYGIYLLGWCGLLSFWPVTLWWLLLAGIGWTGARSVYADLRQWLTGAKAGLPLSPARLGRLSPAQWLTGSCALVLLIYGLLALLACSRPPGPLEWDVISYHLADPKLFLLQHRITSLPAEHHSNFPFTIEMLYTAGLLYNGYTLANLFHLMMAALTVAGMIGFCARTLHPLAGWLGAVVYVTTPIVLWEASTAYIDVGLGLYCTLAAFAAVSYLRANHALSHEDDRLDGVNRLDKVNGTGADTVSRTRTDTRGWLALAGVLMGFALGIKYLALVPFGLIGLLLLLHGVSIRRMLLYAVVALAIGSPWYVKNAVVVSNPVYPFLYKAFPHSRYWTADRAAMYQIEQDKFGTKPLSVGVGGKLRNLLSAPWHILIQRPDYSGPLYCNAGEFNFTALYGGLYAALLFPLVFLRRTPLLLRALMWLALGQLAAWFFLSQVGRYLIPMMPLFAVAGGYASARWAFGSSTRPALPGTLCIAAVFGQAAYVLFGVCTLPMQAPAREIMALRQLGQQPSSVSLPVLLANLGHPEAWEKDLQDHFGPYRAMQWINQNTPPTAGIALYEETRGFYLDRPYIWANRQHSTYIPYDTMRDGTELSAWMRQHGFRYALINLHQSAAYFQPNARQDFPEGVRGHEAEALQKWYADPSSEGDKGHALLGDAVRRGLWKPVFPVSLADGPGNETIVLEITDPPGIPASVPSISSGVGKGGRE